MYKNIIISSCLFGSIYLFSVSLNLINVLLLQNNTKSHILILINGCTLIISGSIFLYSVKFLK
jgi:hypothetical protein